MDVLLERKSRIKSTKEIYVYAGIGAARPVTPERELTENTAEILAEREERGKEKRNGGRAGVERNVHETCLQVGEDDHGDDFQPHHYLKKRARVKPGSQRMEIEHSPAQSNS
jgi:hypothetical protein